MTSIDQILQGQNTSPTQIDTALNKATSLDAKVIDKLNRVTSRKDKLLGMSDADTLRTEATKSLRESAPSGQWYDAIEIGHGTDVIGASKSPNVMAQQKQYIADSLGKNVADVTEQDFVDIGNQQQIQKLADLVQTPGQKRWEAPFIPNTEQTNLTGNYVDETGKPVNVPLDIPVGIDVTGKDKFGRELGSVINPNTGVNVTEQAAQDPMQNIYKKSVDGVKLSEREIDDLYDGDNILLETIDMAQSSLTQQYGKTNKALRKGSRWLAGSVGIDQESVDKWLPKSEEIGTIGYGDITSTDLATQEEADKLTGVMAKTREDQQVGMKNAEAYVSEGEYMDAGIELVKVVPHMIGDMTGEVAAMMAGAPGITLAVAARVSEDAETYAKNNGKDPSKEWLLGSTVTNAVALFGERFIIKSGISGVLQKGVTKAGRVGKVALSAIGEAIQEGYDQTQQEYMTQKEGAQTLGEIAVSPQTQVAVMAGGVTSSALTGTGQAVAAAKDRVPEALEAGRKVVEKATETPEQKVVREYTEFSRPIKESAIANTLDGITDEVVVAAEAMHGKLATDLDESAPKSYTYGVVMRNALNEAHKSGDGDAVSNVYKTMADLDAREDVDFKISDMVEDRMYEATNEFISLINGSESSDSKLAAFGIGKDIAKSAEVKQKEVAGKIDENILTKLEAMKAQLEQEKKDLSSVMGSDQSKQRGYGVRIPRIKCCGWCCEG